MPEETGRPTFRSAFDPRDNSLNFLRLVLASLVVFSHVFGLGGWGEDPLRRLLGGHEGADLGALAVDGFFLLSGFLIARSFLTSPSAARYLWRRFLRIFPGFWVCLVVTAFVFAPLAWYQTHRSMSGFVTPESDSPFAYVFGNALLFMRQFGIGGLLSDLPHATAFNGSLFTLVYEFWCYLLLAALGVLGVLHRRRWVVPILFVGLWSTLLWTTISPGLLDDHVMLELALRFMFLFFIGTLIELNADRLPCSTRWAVAAAVVFLLSLAMEQYRLVGAVPLGYLLIWLGIRLPFSRVGARRDLSYGVYIYSFPLQQLLALLGVAAAGFIPYLGATVALTAIAAFLSWTLVERRALARKNMAVPDWLSRLGGFWSRRARPQEQPVARPGKGNRA